MDVAMPERYRAILLVAAWCGLRFGELTELRRGDVDLDDAAGGCEYCSWVGEESFAGGCVGH